MVGGNAGKTMKLKVNKMKYLSRRRKFVPVERKFTLKIKTFLFLLFTNPYMKSPEDWSLKQERLLDCHSVTTGNSAEFLDSSQKIEAGTSNALADRRVWCEKLEGYLRCKNVNLSHMTRRMWNKKLKMTHGNGQMRHHVSVLHWNLGSKFWEKKLIEIEAVTIQYVPDIFIVTEANLPVDLPEETETDQWLHPDLAEDLGRSSDV